MQVRDVQVSRKMNRMLERLSLAIVITELSWTSLHLDVDTDLAAAAVAACGRFMNVFFLSSTLPSPDFVVHSVSRGDGRFTTTLYRTFRTHKKAVLYAVLNECSDDYRQR